MNRDTGQGLELRPPTNRIDRRAVKWWMLQTLAFWGGILAVFIVMWVVLEPARPWLVAGVVLSSAMLLVGLWVEPFWRYRVHRWEMTHEAVYALTGWLVLEWRVAPISRIQTVDSVRGPFEQLLGLATLTVTTASSNGAIKIVGLDKDVAQETADRLTKIAELIPGDAT